MTKRILILSIAVLLMFSLTACMKRQPVKGNSSQTLKQQESTALSINDNNKNDTSLNAAESANKDSSSNNRVLLDGLAKSLADMGGALDSLESASDEDLTVPIPE